MARLSLAGLGLGVLLAAPASAQDFIRGDSNGDGVVTLADSHRSLYYFFLGGEPLCEDAADFDNSGEPNISDPIKNLRYQVLNDPPPPSPFPGIGPDSGAPDSLLCDDYGGGEPVEDPAATIRVLDEVVDGEDLEATILLAVSSSKRIAGYLAEIDAGGVIAPTQVSHEAGTVSAGLFDLTGTLNAGFLAAATNPSTNRLRIGFLSSFLGAIWIAPGENEIVLEVNVCLEPGTPPGEYPLALTAGELVEYESGGRIDPELIGGTLTIAAPLPSEDCLIERTVPTSKSQLDIVFELGESSGPPGSQVEVPFLITTTDQARTQGLLFSIDFDETALELVDVTTALPRPDEQPWRYEKFQADNSDDVPGSGADEGYGTGRYAYSSFYGPESSMHFPTNEEFTALNLVFEIKPDASLGTAEVTFHDGYDFCVEGGGTINCFPVGNRLIAGQVELSPNLVSSFVLVNGLINIVPDVTIFRRGDSNGDRAVDISDALNTLGYLFLGDRRPACFDAADANDDGKLDIADPIGTLEHLFSSGGPLPPPSSEEGEDPTEDGLTCSTQG